MSRLSNLEAELQQQTRESSKHQQLMRDITELLQDKGPTERDGIVARLCIASNLRLNMALSDLVHAKKIERLQNRHGQLYRIVGDKRDGSTMSEVIVRTYKTRVPRDPCRFNSNRSGGNLS